MKPNEKKIAWVAALFAVAMGLLATPAHAESADAPKPDPATPAPAAGAVDETEFNNEVKVVGYVTLTEVDEKSKTPEIVGTLLTKDGTTVNLRVANPEKMRSVLQKNVGKPMTLIGYYMQNKSVFLANDIPKPDGPMEAPPAGPPDGL